MCISQYFHFVMTEKRDTLPICHMSSTVIFVMCYVFTTYLVVKYLNPYDDHLWVVFIELL